MLKRFYDWMMRYAAHPYAEWILGAVAFIESSFFPIPPDPLYLAMLMANKKRTWRLAFLCTISSVLGGILGYAIGYLLFSSLGTWIINLYHLQDSFDRFRISFQEWGFWIIALKGLTPIPYKVVTIASGVIQLNMGTFIVASIIARGFRFFLLAALFWRHGSSIQRFLEKNLTWITLFALILLLAGYWIVVKL